MTGSPDLRQRVAYLFGDDRHRGVTRRDEANVTSAGNTDIWQLRSSPKDFVRLHIPGNFARQRTKPSLDNVAVILNLVTDPDLNGDVLAIADRFLRGFKGRVINRPAAVLASGRERIHRLLAGIEGLVVPTIARFKGRPNLALAAIDREDIRFPAILRQPGSHNGQVDGLVKDRDDLIARLNPAATYLLTTFLDCKGSESFHHKIRLYWFGDAPLIRHRLISDDWNVHAPSRERVMVHHPEAIAAERALIAAGLDGLPPPARAAMAEVRARMPLDYFGIDFALLPDGRAVLFEANATMNFYPLSTDPRFDYTAAPLEARARPLVDRMLRPDV